MSFNQVKEFHNLFNQPVLDTPTVPSIERCNLRYDLIKEELEELREAFNKKDKVEVLDALCDLMYVVEGTVLEFGMQNIFSKAFNEVHDSNMSKECKSHEVAVKTSEYYEKVRGVLTKIEESPNGFKVINLLNEKTLKSINYKEANLKQFL